MKGSLLFFLSFLTYQTIHSQPYLPSWQSLDSRPVPQWFRDAKFGIFIHWGVYSVPGWCSKGNYAEWYQYGLNNGDTARIAYHKSKFGTLTYYQLADQFKAELFNPDEWVRVMEASGARYVVLTSKHHDGFANWPSPEASKSRGFAWNAMEAGPHRDLLGELFRSVRKSSMYAGLYYSLYEWYNPLWLRDRQEYVSEVAWPQMKDLVNTYQPDVFWTDGDWDVTDEVWKSKEFLAWLYNESPVKDKVVTYDRWGAGIRFNHGGVFTPEYQPDVDFEDHYWEESRGMGFSYGYNREEDAWDYNSSQALILNLVDKVSRGGNFLLDIGPDEHGKIPPIMQERLLQIGDWMKINKEAIYQTTRWRMPAQWSSGKTDFRPVTSSGDVLLKLTVDPDPGFAVKQCFFTYNPTSNNLYAIIPKYPFRGVFTLHDIKLPANTRIVFLETNQQLPWQQMGSNVMIHFPEFDADRVKSQGPYVIRIMNFGAYATKPKVAVSYPSNSLKPLVKLDTKGLECRYTLDGTMPTEKSNIYQAPFYVDSSCILMARCYQADILPGNAIRSNLSIFKWQQATKADVKPGLVCNAYELTPDSVNDLLPEKRVRVDIRPGVSVNDSSRAENYGLEYEGFFLAKSDAVYKFEMISDDGSKMWIDGKEVIDNDGLHGDVAKEGGVALRKGLHRFRLSFIQAGGGATLKLNYQTGSQELVPVPTAAFFYEDPVQRR